MKRVNFSDWQEMALKKDIEQIKRKMTSQESIFFSVCWEIVLALGSIIADHLFDTDKAPEWVWILVISLAAIPAVVIIFIKVFKWICSIVLVKKGKINIKNSVDIFDNQISYWVMLSNAYADMLIEDANGTNAEKEFLYGEGCYYNNKSIHALYAMMPKVDKIFSSDTEKVRKDNLVSMERLLNILRVMNEQQHRLNDSVDNIKSVGIGKQQDLNKKYQNELSNFLNELDRLDPELHIKSEIIP